MQRAAAALGVLLAGGLPAGVLLAGGHAAADTMPAELHTLASGGLRIEIETPADRHAAEFGPRFDRSAVVKSVIVDGVELLGPWGLSDEFGLYGDGVLGYESADIGGHFVKIGVGRLVRDTAEDYHFGHPYPVDALFPVQVTVGDNVLSVSQRSAWAGARQYHYRKSYELLGSDGLVIRYQLTNTGDTPWTFEHYNHHWFRVEGVAVGPGYRVVTGFELPDAETGFRHAPFALDMPAPLASGAAAYYASDLADAPAKANSFAVQVDGRPVVAYQASFRPARFALYASAEGFCPEVFKRAALAPGATASWSATYRFMPRPEGR